MKISQRVSELQSQTVGLKLGWSKFTKEHNSAKTVDGVMVLNLYTSSGDFCICTKFQQKISHRVSELLSGCYLYTEICKGA